MRYRRARHITGAWGKDGFEARSLAHGQPTVLDPFDRRILDICSRWTDVQAIAAALEADCAAARIGEAVERLAGAGLLIRSEDVDPPLESLLDQWAPWTLAAASFHMAIRDVEWRIPSFDSGHVFELEPQPPTLKTYAGAARVELPAFDTERPLARNLSERRSWRSFAEGSLTLPEVAELLGQTWAVRHWAHVGRAPVQALKSAPSGGARHSVEAYVGVLAVDGLEPGLYHYQPDEHALSLLRAGLGDDELQRFFAGQPWFAGAAVAVFQTAVFERVRWRYRHPRAYANVFIELGHLAQTFLLTATDLGLAPFCTAALDNGAVEQALALDGVTEAVFYAVGAGRRPDSDWAPLPGNEVPARREPPSYSKRFTDEHD